MDINDFENGFDDYVKNIIKNKLQEIAEECMDIYKKSIYLNVYSAYKPTWYNRTYTLLNSISYEIVPSNISYYKLRIFNQIPKGTYFSTIGFMKNGILDYYYYNDVSQYVPLFVDEGHHDSTGILNQYHNYDAKKYNQYAINMIKQKYGDLEINIED